MPPRRPGRLATLALLLALAGTPCRGEDLSSEEARWAKDCLARLSANSPRVREGAEAALVELGVDVVPTVADALRGARGRAERTALERVLVRIGREQSVDALRRRLAEARGSEARFLQELIASLGPAGAPGSGAAVALAPSTSLEPRRVPLAAEHALADTLPETLRAGRRAVRREGDALLVDADADGTPERRVPPRGEVLELDFGGRSVPLLVYAKLGTWYACSASLLAGEHEGRSVELLDADLDGRFDGEGDQVSTEGGPFARRGRTGLALWGEDLARFEVDVAGGTPTLRLALQAGPDPSLAEAGRALVLLNRFRRAAGLGPVSLDPQRCAAAALHAGYLAQNVPRGARGSLGSDAHHEDPNAPGYTPEGAAAARESNVSGTDLLQGVEVIGRTMLHRVRWLGDGAGGAGLGRASEGGGWSVYWLGQGTAVGGVPVVVPAPGATDVPSRASPEWPPPDEAPGHYERARGYPVSVTYAPLGYRQVSLLLLGADGATPVPGRLWTPERPISQHLAGNAGTAFFLPDAPLERGATYWAVFTATLDGRPVRHVWTFRTS